MSNFAFLVLIAHGLLMPSPAAAQADDQDTDVDVHSELPSAAELEAAGAIIGRIIIDKQDVFDLSKPEEKIRSIGWRIAGTS